MIQHWWKIDKYFSFAKWNLRQNSFTNLRHFLTFPLFVFIENNLTSRQSKQESQDWESQQFTLIRVWGSRVSTFPIVYSLKRPISYCCRICTILRMIFKISLFVEALYRPLFTKYAHCKPLFTFQNNT